MMVTARVCYMGPINAHTLHISAGVARSRGDFRPIMREQCKRFNEDYVAVCLAEILDP